MALPMAIDVSLRDDLKWAFSPNLTKGTLSLWNPIMLQ
jgi:hypothetical protein